MPWVCEICSHNNNDEATVCEVCDSPRPAAAPKKTTKKSTAKSAATTSTATGTAAKPRTTATRTRKTTSTAAATATPTTPLETRPLTSSTSAATTPSTPTPPTTTTTPTTPTYTTPTAPTTPSAPSSAYGTGTPAPGSMAYGTSAMSLSAKRELVKRARRGNVDAQRTLSESSLCTPYEQAAWSRCAQFNENKRKKFLIADLVMTVLAFMTFAANAYINAEGSPSKLLEFAVLFMLPASIVFFVISFSYQIVFLVNKSKPAILSVLCMFKILPIAMFANYLEALFNGTGSSVLSEKVFSAILIMLFSLAWLTLLEWASLKKR